MSTVAKTFVNSRAATRRREQFELAWPSIARLAILALLTTASYVAIPKAVWYLTAERAWENNDQQTICRLANDELASRK